MLLKELKTFPGNFLKNYNKWQIFLFDLTIFWEIRVLLDWSIVNDTIKKSYNGSFFTVFKNHQK